MPALKGTLHFFAYETIKIMILLFVIVFIISIIRTFLSPTKVKRILTHKRTYVGNIIAALIGIVTPFCSCSAVPMYLGLIEAGVPLGVTFSFLVSSPMINEVALVMLLGLFGYKIALLYIGSGLVISILSGIVIGKLKVERLLIKSVVNPSQLQGQEFNTWEQRLNFARDYTMSLVSKIWIYVVIGIGIGAWIHGYVPVDFLAKYAGKDKWFAVPLATIIGIPLYSSTAAMIPLINALTEKGVSMGTALAFMMSVTALSFPEFTILKRVMKVKLIIIFASVVGIGIMITGVLFNIWIK